MGFLNSVFGNGSSGSVSVGGHAIDHGRVLQRTADGVINPMNPGNFSSIRTSPVVTNPRYFDIGEAEALRNLAQQKAQGAQHSVRAYKALSRLEKSDEAVHKAHRKYEKQVAESELGKLQSNANLARKLHGQRPQYARLGAGLDQSNNSAQHRINELNAKVKRYF